MRPRRFCRGELEVREAGKHTVGRASMRPRRFCRGEARAGARSPSPRASFNEAPAILPGRGRAKPCHFGEGWHGFNEAPAILPGRDELRVELHQSFGTASMRPRRFCRGEPEWTTSFSVASMKRFNEAPAILPGRGPRFQVAELWHVPCRFARAAWGESCPRWPAARSGLRIVKERRISQCVTASRAVPGGPRAPECSQTGRQAPRHLAIRL